MIIPVTDTTYFRDLQSKALVNKDINGLQEYKTKRKFAELQRQEINSVKQEVECIKCDIKEIKILMQQLLEKG